MKKVFLFFFRFPLFGFRVFMNDQIKRLNKQLKVKKLCLSLSKYDISYANEVENTIKINFFGTLNVCNALFPLLRPHARVVNVASDSGMLATIRSETLRKRFSDENATIQDICDIMNEFLE